MGDRKNGSLPRPGIVLARVIKNSMVHVTMSFKISSKRVPHMRALPLMCTFPSGDLILTVYDDHVFDSRIEGFCGERPSGKAFATMSWS